MRPSFFPIRARHVLTTPPRSDRGLDNFMARVCYDTSEGHPPHPHFHLAAIDNSLAFPHQHPLGWRTFLYGWLNLPLSLIGQPWSASTRKAFLPKLSDPEWWRDLRRELRSEFKRDKTFREDVWQRQWAVVKGQGWNLVESLKSEDEGACAFLFAPKRLLTPPPPSQVLSNSADGQRSSYAKSSPSSSSSPLRPLRHRLYADKTQSLSRPPRRTTFASQSRQPPRALHSPRGAPPRQKPSRQSSSRPRRLLLRLKNRPLPHPRPLQYESPAVIAERNLTTAPPTLAHHRTVHPLHLHQAGTGSAVRSTRSSRFHPTRVQTAIRGRTRARKRRELG